MMHMKTKRRLGVMGYTGKNNHDSVKKLASNYKLNRDTRERLIAKEYEDQCKEKLRLEKEAENNASKEQENQLGDENNEDE